jgi:IMP dehydrogenase
MEKASSTPMPAKDEQGRLRVAAATTVGEDGFERAERLVDAGVDVIVVDTAHGHSQRVLDAVPGEEAVQSVQVIAGNVATREASRR